MKPKEQARFQKYKDPTVANVAPEDRNRILWTWYETLVEQWKSLIVQKGVAEENRLGELADQLDRSLGKNYRERKGVVKTLRDHGEVLDDEVFPLEEDPE